MNVDTDIRAGSRPAGLLAGILVRFVTIAFVFLLQALFLFVAAGTTVWIWAWIFLAIGVVCMGINGTVMLRTNPETAAERGRPKHMENWDKIISVSWGLLLYLALPLAAGLDLRFAWTAGYGAGWHVAGAVAYAAGLALTSWAMISNAFFSTAARIQDDRGHTVCQTGPYRVLRHPGYTGNILQSFATPILLGSLWALLPVLAASVFIVARTVMEDRMLQEKLEGYKEYARRVRYRLFPGIW
jgi:protein-S-isoprenylcysteine O-methyltransferase Ste14